MNARWIRFVASLAIVAFLFAGCGDDDDDATSPDDADTEDTAPEEGEAEGDDETIEVTMIDYGYEGLPDTIDAGTTLTVRNDSETEMHELVAVLLPEDEERSVEELLALPEEELMALFDGEPAAVLLATPGSDETIPAVGTGTLDDPGRYVIACFIPQGADPQAFMDAAGESEGPPDVEGGPPHFILGMQAELRVQ